MDRTQACLEQANVNSRTAVSDSASDRPSLSADRWLCGSEPEFSQVRTTALADMARASRAIAAIGRILHNAIDDDEDNMAGRMLDNWTKQNLAGAIECLSDVIYDHIETETFNAAEANRVKPQLGEHDNG